ncbi:MAG: transposase [Kiritimatiellales bacterium]
MLPKRKKLPHGIPSWVPDGADFFITICVRNRAENSLCKQPVAGQLKDSFMFLQTRRELWIHLLLFMPDHLHAIISFAREPGMQKSIKNWKHYTKRAYGINWQRDFFDHRMRATDSYIEKAGYIRMNPVRAGFVQSPADWPYVWENRIR